jgi:Fe-S-cluster containining protein
MNCDSCGGRCCGFLPLPPDTTPAAMRTMGVPVNVEAMPYLALHQGVRIERGRLFLEQDTPLVAYDGRLGRVWLAAAPCRWLEHGRCAHYEQRPQECRAYDSRTAPAYFVPIGCKFDDERHMGEDFSEVIRAGKEA